MELHGATESNVALVNLDDRTGSVGKLPGTALPMPGNLVASDVPGPPMPLYTAGARIESRYPVSLLPPGQGLNITVISYGGRMDSGFTVDPDLIPDPWYLAEVPLAMEELRATMGQRSAQARPNGSTAPEEVPGPDSAARA